MAEKEAGTPPGGSGQWTMLAKRGSGHKEFKGPEVIASLEPKDGYPC